MESSKVKKQLIEMAILKAYEQVVEEKNDFLSLVKWRLFYSISIDYRAEEKMMYKIIVAHPGKQHSFRLATALK